MKKYWQIKPWVLMVVLAVFVVGGLVYAFAEEVVPGLFRNNRYESSSMSQGYAPEPMMDMAYDSEEYYGVKKSISPDFNQVDVDGSVARMMIKSGDLSMVVDDVHKSIDDIVAYVDAKGGFLVTSNVNKYGASFSGYLTVRVPSEDLDDTILYVKGMGDVESEHIDASDITEEYVDLESELKTLRATEGQFLEIMKRAVKVEDVLSVQRELGYVRGNIERIEGRMKYLNQSVDLSSLTVYLSTNPAVIPVVTEDDKWEPLVIFKDALRSLLDTGRGFLNALIWVGVYLPIILIFVFIVWRVKRCYKGKCKKSKKS